MSNDHSYDLIIIGGGPAGATSALIAARAGLRVVLVEKSKFPRFHIGESILPRNFPLIQELGLEAALNRVPHVPKFGAEFGMGDGTTTTRFTFDKGLIPGSRTFNIERAVFDEMLLNEARAAGANVLQETAVKEILSLADGDVRVRLDNGEELRALYLLDASGHGTVVARHLGIRKNFTNPELQKVAYFNHFENVERLPGSEAGHPGIIMCKEGWFWLIALNERITSVGFVTRPDFVRQIAVPPNRLLQWAIARCPLVRHRMRDACGPETNEVLSDFSYTCKPLAGSGYFLVGDAGAFLDPIFSTGVTLAMMGAVQAANHAITLVRGGANPNRARREYIRYVEGSTGVFWRLIRGYYHHSFRELFLNGRGPLNVHNAIISILAGHVFPKPPWCLRWRLWLFELCMNVNKMIPLVPRVRNFSLMESEATPTVSANEATVV